MSYSIDVKNKAKILRNKGYSLNDISKILRISSTTVFYWIRNIKLNKEAQIILNRRMILNRKRATETKQKEKEIQISKIKKVILNELKNIEYDQIVYKLLCSFLFWSEGNKITTSVSFINSDPEMIEVFLFLLRKSYKIDEKKFRDLVHIHEYHDENNILNYWSKISNIPIEQFSKSYLKPHTGIRKKENYLGSFRIRYYDAKIAKELTYIYKVFSKNIGLW
jgi:chaperonin cofactor prefoldin